jgi:hypothetical protein
MRVWDLCIFNLGFFYNEVIVTSENNALKASLGPLFIEALIAINFVKPS